MSSFYGNGGISSGGGGTSDYNQLTNIPIKNMTGTEGSPVNFSLLSFGQYKITGYYIFNKDSEVFNSNTLYISIFEDNETKKKIVKFEEFENSQFYIMTLTYEDDGTYIEDRFSPSQGSSEVTSEIKLLSF